MTNKRIKKWIGIDTRYLFKGGVWLLAFQIVTMFAGVISTVILTKLLTQNDFGIYRYLINLAGLLSVLSLTGIGQAILQSAAKGIAGFYQSAVGVTFKYSLITSFASILIGTYYFLNENLTLAIGCFAIALIQPIINVYQNVPNALYGLGRFKEASIVNSLKTITVLSATIITVFFTQNIFILFAAFLLSNAIISYVIHVLFTKRTKVGTVQEQTYQQYLSFAKHTSIRNALSLASNKLDALLIFTHIGAVELAIYFIANLIPEQIKNSIKNLSILAIPKYAKQNEETLRHSVKTKSLQLLPILLGITFLYILVTPVIYGLLFSEYTNAITYSQLAALSIPSLVLLLPYSALQVELSNKKLHQLIGYSSLLQTILTIVGVVTFGILGAIVSRIIYRYSLTILTYYFFFKTEKLKKT